MLYTITWGLVNKLQQFLDDDGCDEETFQAGTSHLTSAVGDEQHEE